MPFCKRFSIFCVILLFCNLFYTLSCMAANLEKPEKRVLILNSYNQEDPWEQSIRKSISDSIKNSNYNIITHIDYMETRQFSGDRFYDILAQFYKNKYKSFRFDVIIVCDNDAFDFMNKFHDEIFSGIPVVFCGVNHFQDDIIVDKPYITGVAENIDIKSTIDIALKLHPSTKEIYSITDNTNSGLKIKSSIEDVTSSYKNKVKFNFNKYEDIDDILSSVQNMQKDSIILLGGGGRKSSGEYMSMTECAEILSGKSAIPIYGFWDFYLGHGVVGGMMTTGKEQGKEAAALALRVLNGEKPSNIPVIKTLPDIFMFDYNKLKDYNIQVNGLSNNVVLINEPTHFYAVPKRIIWIISFAILCVLIFGVSKLRKNIRQRKLAEKALRENEERLRTLINASPDAICFMDGEGRWMESNESNLKLYGIYGINYRGLTNDELAQYSKCLSDRREYLNESDKAAWEGKIVQRGEESIASADGEVKIFDTIKVPLFYSNGSRKGLVVLGREITEHKRSENIKIKAEENKKLLQEAMQYDKLKTEFFSNISHELRTPLNVMLSTIQLLELYRSNGSIVDNGINLERKMFILRQNSLRLLRLVNNLIDITKIDAGYYELQLQNNDIVSVVEDITLSVVEYAESKKISLIFDTDVEERVTACDSDKIERIMLNLLSNAVKFTRPLGKITVNIYDGEDNITIVVGDTGIGIPKEKQELIFERFRQVDKSLNRINEGSGIGLSLVKSLVMLHGGSISVESNYNQGSKFKIKLPVRVIPEQELKPDNTIRSQEGEARTNLEFSDIYS